MLGAIYVDVPKAIQGWVAWKNSQGGIKCHPIRFVTRDDGGDPARMQALTKELVEKERVIAMVGQHAPITGGATVDYITQKRIPMIGSAGTESHFYDRSPMYFPQQPSGILRYLAQVAVARDIALPQGKKKLGTLACQESTECAEASDVSARYADKYGLQMAYQARASIAQPDYTSNCQAAQSAGVEMLLVYLDSASAERVARSCASINYRPTFATTAVAENLAANKQLDGLLAGVVNGIWFDNGNPAIAEYRSILQKYAPGARLSTYSVAGWAAAELFEVAAANISDQPSSEDLLKGLWAIKGNDLGGLTQPLTFVPNKPSSPREMCYWIVQTRAGQWISPNGSQRTCTEGIVP